MRDPKYKIVEDMKWLHESGHKFPDEGSTITATITFFADSNILRQISLVYSWNFDADADDFGRAVDRSYWTPKLNGRVEDIQLFAEKHPDWFKQIPNEHIRSSDPDEVKGELEFFFEQLGISAE